MFSIVYNRITTTIFLLGLIIGFATGCGPSSTAKRTHSFYTDSVHVEELLRRGDSLYALRDGLNTIAESLLYFDSANRIATRLGDTLLRANTLYYIGNVYNAWNQEPQTTVAYYTQSVNLYNRLPQKAEKAFYVYYLLAHAYDGEKAADTIRCLQTLRSALTDLQAVPRLRTLPDAVARRWDFLSDFAWVATNAGSYGLADSFLRLVPRAIIVNDPESNNYLDHYYLTRSRVDVFGQHRTASPYLDSLQLSLQHCNNRFDSGYYAVNLARLYSATANYERAYYYLDVSNRLANRMGNSNVLSVLQKSLLNSELTAQQEKEKAAREELRSRNLLLGTLGLLVAVAVLIVWLWVVARKRQRDRRRVIQQQQFTYLLLQKEEDERRRIATDLHDGINHDLLALKNKLLLAHPVDATDVEAIITGIREVSRNLYPALFDTIGLAGSVQALCDRMTAGGFFTSCDIQYQPMLSKQDELQLYRIIQEAISNAAKHAGAEAARITIKTDGGNLFVEVKDNGGGFLVDDPLQKLASFGLQSMWQRAEAMQATLRLSSSSSGTVIQLTKTI